LHASDAKDLYHHHHSTTLTRSRILQNEKAAEHGYSAALGLGIALREGRR